MPSPPRKAFPFRIEFPPELPISARAEEITAAIQASPVVIIAGETGSGKTTQIPKMCLVAGGGARGRIACTQPRRVAALSISRRVAEELGVEWGREVGCKIRFNDQTTPQTTIKFLTDGMLLAEVQGDPLLREYDTIIIDEAHERSLNIDFLLGHLRGLRFKRPELKIVITSATIDTAAFSAAFDGAPVIVVEGRTFPVEVIYVPLDGAEDWSLEAPSPGEEAMDEESRAAERAAHVAEHAEALHYIDGTVEAVERIVGESEAGDVLIFLPSERDIREVLDLLEGRLKSSVELVPLFGRLSNAEQQRVFAPAQRRKIVVATNIAETSLTIPGIRFVVDSGLARVSRYVPQGRTRRLPIEEIAQSSADQRKGRSGRVADGVCIRLFSEKDYLERPRFAQPEIQRANLADVILRLKAYGLGDIERFPFINMPAAKAIRAGYLLLEEIGALERSAENRGRTTDDGRQTAEGGGQSNLTTDGGGRTADKTEARDALPQDQMSAVGRLSSDLTAIGRELARLPVDPTVGRMILQARTEKALREVIVIAAGLSIQDPRERPLDKQQQADMAHRRFIHPDSDFLTLLKIWETYHNEFETLSQAKLRGFCRDHFLSYTRMREWRDIHAQLLDVLKERDDFRMSSVFDGVGTSAASTRYRGVGASLPRDKRDRSGISRGKPAPTTGDALAFGSPGYRAIHRSILSGLLGNIAHFDEESGLYKATHDRKVVLFPGSVLFRRDAPKKKPSSVKPAEGNAARDKRVLRWILASEIMETTRLYARTCARLDPAWALDLGAHVVRVSHSEPFWNAEAGRVMVKQRTRLHGLELETRAVSYGKIDPVHATEIFIREGLVNDTISYPLDFLAHNRKLREQLEELLTRTRDTGYLNLDEAVYRFYADRLEVGPAPAPAEASREGRVRSGPGLKGASAGTQAGSESQPHLQISSVAELVDLVRERRGAEPRFLMLEPENLRASESPGHDAAAFPAALPLENRALPLNYAYKPGQADDGVTLDVTVREAETLTAAALDWAVPGHLEAKVEHHLRALPKALRVKLASDTPLGEVARELAAALQGGPTVAKPMAGEPVPVSGARPARRSFGEGGSAPPTLVEALATQIRTRFNVAVDPAVWADKPLPEHLRVRVRVVDDRGRELCASRDLPEIEAALSQHRQKASATVARVEPEAWRQARLKWEVAPQTSWAFGDVPEQVLVTEQAGVPVHAFPGLSPESGERAGKAGPAASTMAEGVALRLFKTVDEARASTTRGLAALLERQLSHDLGWLERDLRALRELGPLLSTLVPVDELQRQVFGSIRQWVCDPARIGVGAALPSRPEFQRALPQPRAAADPAFAQGYGGRGSRPHLTTAAFSAALDRAKADLRGLVPRLVDLLREILAARQQLLVVVKPPSWLAGEIEALVPRDFLGTTPYAQLAHFPRYLKALQLRCERWRQNPVKDAERAAQLAPYLAALAGRSTGGARGSLQDRRSQVAAVVPTATSRDVAVGDDRRYLSGSKTGEGNCLPRVGGSFRWLVEEFKVSLFAQELGTAEPVSVVKLDRALAALKNDQPPLGEVSGRGTKPIVTAAMPQKKSAPLKNLGALDRLFPK